MNLEKIIEEAVKETLLGRKTDNACCEKWGRHIVILQRGWVMCGILSKQGEYFTLDDANVIRRWGTKEGLGELASKGPRENTKLEPTPQTKFHELTMIGAIKCDEAKW